jgi:hypothetical protein
MAKNTLCKSCGANNDLLYTICTFCNTPLEAIDINHISDQDLIMNLGEWIGKLEGIDKRLGVTISTDSSTGINKKLGLQNTKTISYSEICGNIERYLNILKVRANNNLNILVTVQDSEKKYALYKKEAEKNRIKKFLPFIVILITFLLFSIYLIIKPGSDEEHEKLQVIETDIENAIMDKNYDKAFLLIERLQWTYEPKFHEAEIQMYEQKRNNMKELINSKKQGDRK